MCVIFLRADETKETQVREVLLLHFHGSFFTQQMRLLFLVGHFSGYGEVGVSMAGTSVCG